MTARSLREKAAAALLGASITTLILGLCGAPQPYSFIAELIAELAMAFCAGVAIGARIAEKRIVRRTGRAEPPDRSAR